MPKVLGVGGSSGVMAQRFAREGCRVSAIDIDEAAIEAAQQGGADPNGTFPVAHAMGLEYPGLSQ